jgi:hypothetical protein
MSSKVLNNGTAVVEAKENSSPLDYERKPSRSSKEAPSSNKVSLSNSSHSHQIVRSDYLLRSKLKIMEEASRGGGLAIDKGPGGQARRKFFISLSQSKALKKIRSAQQSTIVQALRAGVAQEGVKQ